MKTRSICFIAFIFTSILHAQIPNSSFEDNNHCNLSAYWSYKPLQAFIIDSSGNTITDSIVWDGIDALNCPVSDAHTGSTAISLRNAYSYNTGDKYPGRSILFPDSSECTAFFFTLLPISYNPQEFSFFYKYAPINGDTAYAIAVLYDQFGTEVGRAEKWIMGIQNTYIQEVIPFNYSSSDSVALYSISFHNMIADGYPHQSTFGTRLTIDDVSFDGNMSVPTTNEEISIFPYPNPTQETVNIQTGINVTVSEVSVINMHGQSFSLPMKGLNKYDCSALSNGVYQLKIITDKGVTFRKLIKD